MLVDSGVQLDKADQAREEILRQLAAVSRAISPMRIWRRPGAA